MIGTIRTTRGRLHVAKLDGNEWVCACWRTFPTRRPDLIIYRGNDAVTAYQYELVCADCTQLLNRGPEGFKQGSGW